MGAQQRIGEPQGNEGEEAIAEGLEGVSGGRAGLRAADAAPKGAGQPVTPGAIDRQVQQPVNQRAEGDVLGHHRPGADGDQRQIGELRCRGKRDQERQHDQEAEKQLLRQTGVFERLAGQAHMAPQMAADVGLAPEPVGAEGKQPEHRVPEGDAGELAALVVIGQRHRYGRAGGRGRIGYYGHRSVSLVCAEHDTRKLECRAGNHNWHSDAGVGRGLAGLEIGVSGDAQGGAQPARGRQHHQDRVEHAQTH